MGAYHANDGGSIGDLHGTDHLYTRFLEAVRRLGKEVAKIKEIAVSGAGKARVISKASSR